MNGCWGSEIWAGVGERDSRIPGDLASGGPSGSATAACRARVVLPRLWEWRHMTAACSRWVARLFVRDHRWVQGNVDCGWPDQKDAPVAVFSTDPDRASKWRPKCFAYAQAPFNRAYRSCMHRRVFAPLRSPRSRWLLASMAQLLEAAQKTQRRVQRRSPQAAYLHRNPRFPWRLSGNRNQGSCGRMAKGFRGAPAAGRDMIHRADAKTTLCEQIEHRLEELASSGRYRTNSRKPRAMAQMPAVAATPESGTASSRGRSTHRCRRQSKGMK